MFMRPFTTFVFTLHLLYQAMIFPNTTIYIHSKFVLQRINVLVNQRTVSLQPGVYKDQSAPIPMALSQNTAFFHNRTAAM